MRSAVVQTCGLLIIAGLACVATKQGPQVASPILVGPPPLISAERGPSAKQLVVDGRTLVEAGLDEEASVLFAQAWSLSPSYGLAWLEWAVVAERMGVDDDLGDQALQKAVLRMPENPRAFFQLGLFLERRGDVAKARDAFERVVALRPEHTWAQLRLGQLLVDKELWVEAVGHFQRVIGSEPAHVAGQLGLAQAAEGAGELAVAEQALRRLVHEHPHIPSYKVRLAAFLTRTGQAAQARKVDSEIGAPDEGRRKLRPLKASRN